MIYIGQLRFTLLNEEQGKMFLVANIPIFSKAPTFGIANGIKVGIHPHYRPLREAVYQIVMA